MRCLSHGVPLHAHFTQNFQRISLARQQLGVMRCKRSRNAYKYRATICVSFERISHFIPNGAQRWLAAHASRFSFCHIQEPARARDSESISSICITNGAISSFRMICIGNAWKYDTSHQASYHNTLGREWVCVWERERWKSTSKKVARSFMRISTIYRSWLVKYVTNFALFSASSKPFPPWISHSAKNRVNWTRERKKARRYSCFCDIFFHK